MHSDEHPEKFEFLFIHESSPFGTVLSLPLEGQTSANMEERTQREIENLRKTFSSLQDHESIERFARVWEEIGLKSEHRQERRGNLLILSGRCQATGV